VWYIPLWRVHLFKKTILEERRWNQIFPVCIHILMFEVIGLWSFHWLCWSVGEINCWMLCMYMCWFWCCIWSRLMLQDLLFLSLEWKYEETKGGGRSGERGGGSSFLLKSQYLYTKLWCLITGIQEMNLIQALSTRWFKYDRGWLCVNKSQFVPIIFEPPCTMYCFQLRVAVIHKIHTKCWNLVEVYRL
jgi:hypothetical protein